MWTNWDHCVCTLWGCGCEYECVRVCVHAHGCPWAQNTSVSINVKFCVCVLVHVWRGMHVKEWMYVDSWASAAQDMFERETAGVHYSCEQLWEPAMGTCTYRKDLCAILYVCTYW